ncbi:MAG: PQQ-binding-like beta-propeller repeat protein [Flavobacteriales bacterium]|nr:PQQ-binding-like beta-propeller repeat protein [Flavobacteriales bacterium]
MLRSLPLPFALFLASTALSTQCHAQATPAWQQSPGGSIAWMRTTSTGNLVVCTSEGLTGLDPATGSITWTVKELANAPESGYEEIQNTPFIAVAPAGATDHLVILEPFGGTVLFSSAESGIGHIASKYFLYANNAIVLVGQRADKTAVMACVDMGTGKVRWTKEDAFSKLTSCSSAGKDAILLSTLFFAYKLDANSGAELWKQSPDPKFASMASLMGALDKGGANLSGPAAQTQGVFVTTPHAPELCFMGLQQTKQSEKTDAQGKKTVTITYTSFFNAFRIADGSYAWAQPLQFQQQLGTVVPLKQGLLVGAGDKNSVDMLDYNTGNGLWGKNGKGIAVSGPLSGAVEMDGKTLLTSGGKDGVAMLVDGTGSDLWEKKVKLGGAIQSVTEMPGALLIASSEEADVVDLATGVSKLGKPFKGGAGTVAVGEGEVFLFNNKDHLLYRMPIGGGTATALSTAPLEFDGSESASHVELVGDGVVVSSDQNIAMFGKDGSLKYKKYFPAPRESGLTRALLYASAVRAAYYTAAFGYTSAAFGAVSQNIQVTDAGSAAGKEITGQLSNIYGDATTMAMDYTKQFIARANARFKATASTGAVQYILSDAGKREFVLMRVHKSDGSLGESIPLGKDKTPLYEVDGFDNAVYLVSGANMVAYR